MTTQNPFNDNPDEWDIEMIMNDSSLAEHVVELLAGTGEVKARRMFGGVGIFDSGLMFALIAGGRLYFKVDGENEAAFAKKELTRFTYQRNGRGMHLNYREAPPEALETKAAMERWAGLGMDAARRAKPKPAPSRGRRKP